MIENKIKNLTVESDTNQGVLIGTNNGLIINGMNYTDVRALCLDLIRDEIEKNKQSALIEAKKRDDELMLKFFEELSKIGITEDMLKKALEEPAMQIDLIEAEKSYIKYGNQELKNILSDILTKRVSENQHTLLQIALGESIKTVPLLLPSQMATLALCFLLRHTKNFLINNHVALTNYLTKNILPIYRNGVSKKESEFQHLSYTRCATISISSVSLINIFLNVYTGLFVNGFDLSDVPNSNDGTPLNAKYPSFFIRCLSNSEKYQINAMDEETLDDRFIQTKMPDYDQRLIKNLFNNNKMTPEQAKKKIIELCPEFEEIFEYWDGTSIKNLNLSSVGIVIGAFFASNKTNQHFDLNIWI